VGFIRGFPTVSIPVALPDKLRLPKSLGLRKSAPIRGTFGTFPGTLRSA
jgi:hypothetical protein